MMTNDSKAAGPKLVVLISGSGSNLQSFIDQSQDGRLPAQIACVVSNRPEAKGLDRAQKAGIETCVIDHKAFDSREAFDAALADQIDQFTPDLVILAGFMRILTPEFVARFEGRMMNIHPSLLPKYPGLHTHQRAIDAGDSHAGATVHFVTAELDGGPPVLQAEVAINDGDDAATLAANTLVFEHQIYPLAARWYVEKRLVLKADGAYLDGDKLPASGVTFNSLGDIQ